eukprot:scaffold49553_cov30-Tisochrysis_lutea.AAC.2
MPRKLGKMVRRDIPAARRKICSTLRRSEGRGASPSSLHFPVSRRGRAGLQPPCPPQWPAGPEC